MPLASRSLLQCWQTTRKYIPEPSLSKRNPPYPVARICYPDVGIMYGKKRTQCFFPYFVFSVQKVGRGMYPSGNPPVRYGSSQYGNRGLYRRSVDKKGLEDDTFNNTVSSWKHYSMRLSRLRGCVIAVRGDALEKLCTNKNLWHVIKGQWHSYVFG